GEPSNSAGSPPAGPPRPRSRAPPGSGGPRPAARGPGRPGGGRAVPRRPSLPRPQVDEVLLVALRAWQRGGGHAQDLEALPVAPFPEALDGSGDGGVVPDHPAPPHLAAS